jgi:tripartite-type tricarboxylate transporter receptor subunit TctC
MKRCFTAVLLLAAAGAVPAQPYPVKPVRLLVGYAPGGTGDVSARIVADAAGKLLGQNLIVENRPGAGGGIAIEGLLRAPADGYTLVVAPDSSLYLPVMKPSLPFRAGTHFSPVTILTNQALVIVVHPAPGWKSIRELVAAARARPGALSYALPTATGTQAIAAAMFFRQAGVKLQSVPYKGGGQAVIDVIGGQLPIGVLGPPPVMPHIASGRLRALAVTSRTRSKSLPNVPTLAESGYADFHMTQWFGALGPLGLPPDVVDRLSAVFIKVLADPAVVQRIEDAGLEPVGGSPETFARRIQTEVVAWTRVVQELGMKAD